MFSISETRDPCTDPLEGGKRYIYFYIEVLYIYIYIYTCRLQAITKLLEPEGVRPASKAKATRISGRCARRLHTRDLTKPSQLKYIILCYGCIILYFLFYGKSVHTTEHTQRMLVELGTVLCF